MKREILFRAKRLDNGEWVEGFVNKFDSETKILTNESEEDPSQFGAYHIKKQVVHKVIPETVGQFTGLCDKNGKKIFEGDIVKFRTKRFHTKNQKKNGVAKWEWFKSTVCYEDGCFCISEGADYNDTYLSAMRATDENKIEVIGNIFDTPDYRSDGNI